MSNPVILFIPVTSLSGIGEYTRSLIIANTLHQKWPKAAIHFILNEAVPYFEQCPFPVHPCKDSATKDINGVNKVIERLKPDLVIFDASGRAAQFKAARKVGAKVAFISQHAKKRRRGLKLNRIFLIDQHWVAQPDFCISPLSLFQRLKLSLFQRPIPKNIGAVFSQPTAETIHQVLTKFGLSQQGFYIFNAGSGGHKTFIDSKEQLSADIYYQAAQDFFKKTQQPTIMIFGDNYPKKIPQDTFIDEKVSSNIDVESIQDKNRDNKLMCLKSLTNEEFIVLLGQAQGRVISAGDTLLQCMALQKVCIAAAVSKDQPKRLDVCAKSALVYKAKLTVESLSEQSFNLFNNDKKLPDSLNTPSCVDGLTLILKDIELLLIDKIRAS